MNIDEQLTVLIEREGNGRHYHHYKFITALLARTFVFKEGRCKRLAWCWYEEIIIHRLTSERLINLWEYLVSK
jgi:hypothetical protein